jgi:hypothetical protein
MGIGPRNTRKMHVVLWARAEGWFRWVPGRYRNDYAAAPGQYHKNGTTLFLRYNCGVTMYTMWVSFVNMFSFMCESVCLCACVF